MDFVKSTNISCEGALDSQVLNQPREQVLALLESTNRSVSNFQNYLLSIKKVLANFQNNEAI